MDFVRGMVVRSAAGRDKNGFFAVLEANDRYALICDRSDGRRRSLSNPKKKKYIHLFPTKTVLTESSLQTNRVIRAALKDFNVESPFLHEEA